jgi:hypothetical protein
MADEVVTRRGAVKAVAAGLLTAGLSGCGAPAAVLLLRQQVDELLKAANHAIDTFGKESTAWRAKLDELHDKLKATGQDLLANDLRAYTDRTVGKVGEELRCNIDFIEGKVKAYLIALRDALAEAKNQLLLTSDLKTAQRIVAGIAVKVDADVTPGVCSFSPAVINVAWADHRSPQVSGVQGNHVYLSGYGFKPRDPKVLTLWVESADKKRRDVTQYLTVHTAYSASIDMSNAGLRFTPDNVQDRRILLLYRDGEIGAVKLQWGDRPPVPPKLVNIKSVLTTTTHKEAGGQVELTFFHNDRKLADSLHAQKRNLFGNLVADFTGHIGAYQTWNKGHVQKFSPPGGLAFIPEYKPGDKIKVQIALGAVPGERNINWRGEVKFSVLLDDKREISIGTSGGFWFRNNVVEDPQHLRGNRIIEVTFPLPPLPPM